MSTNRIPISTVFNNWHDAQQVDVSDMTTEQTRNIQTEAAIINNHFGSGILPSSLTQGVIFDSDSLTITQAEILAAGNFDGTGLDAQLQPSDSNLGNQLEVQLTGTSAFGRLCTKVLIIGLDFQENTQYDRITFFKDEIQTTRKHYSKILSIFFVDFKGNNNCSRDLGGRIIIRETNSFQLSRDAIMAAQDVEPNLFFRDFKVSNKSITLYNTLQAGIGPEFTVDSLNINTTVKQNRSLSAGDVVTKIGEKFLASTNNIQKITLLLGAAPNATAPIQNEFDWTGSLVISVWSLQTTVSCPTDIIPELAIDFDPSSEPLAQLSFSQSDLKNLGYVLNDVLQPVDFVFSSTKLGFTNSNSPIIPGNMYAVTMNRSGAANSGTVFTGVGNHSVDNARLTLFSGVWGDVTEEDLWFQIWTDAGKVADGQAYDSGNGMQIEKTITNNIGAQVDYSLSSQPLIESGQNILNVAVVQAIQTQTHQEQDERTGQPIFVRQQFEPEVSFVTESDLTKLKSVSNPLIIGGMEDINPKQNYLAQKLQRLPGLANGDVFTVVNPDADLLSQNLIGSKLIPDTGCIARDYRIFKTMLCTDGYGDVNGDGVIDTSDVIRATQLLGESIASPTTQQKIVDGYISTLELLRADVDGDGTITTADITAITQYVTRVINSFHVGSTFKHMDITVQESIGRFDGYYDCDGYVRIDGYIGNNIINPANLNIFQEIYDGYIVTPNIDGEDSAFNTVPFIPVIFQIVPQVFWQDYMLVCSSDARVVPAAFASDTAIVINECTETSLLECINTLDIVPTSDPGRNDISFPDNIILRRGQILTPDGSHHKIDFEIGQVILELPELELSQVSMNVFEKFVSDVGGGKTSAGYNAMRFSDCSTVKSDALLKNQVKFDVSIQAIGSNVDGYDYDLDAHTSIVDGQIGVLVDQSTGILTLNIKDLSVDQIYRANITKIQITIYLKQGGFNNNTLIIPPEQISGLLAL